MEGVALGAASLVLKCVGNLAGGFWVPAYQRGYRWGKLEVEHLLDDIWESGGAPYRLQPVVVKFRPQQELWELIDGQQRLTTLFLIFQYMQNARLHGDGAPFSIHYETRRASREFLRAPEAARSAENIDFSHIFKAYEAIGRWFERQKKLGHRMADVAERFHTYLSDSVQVIWYEVPFTEDGVALFTRLNVGRIPLTDAELVRALLLSTTDAMPAGRSPEVASQWDVIERELRDPQVWAFVAGSRGEPTHITLLLDCLADRIVKGGAGRDRLPFHTFETLRSRISGQPLEFWDEVLDLHSLVMGWYEDRDVFHRVGFLVAEGASFADLVVQAKNITKSRFIEALDQRIERRLDLTETALQELTYESAAACSRVLLLMNVETVRRMEDSTHRYSFEAHAAGRWSLEHIHAQQSKELSTQAQRTEWLRLHAEVLETLPGVADVERAQLLERIANVRAKARIRGHEFLELRRQVQRLYEHAGPAHDGDVDSIANLALLRREVNSAISNGVFEAKRRHILALDRNGSFIPVCTRNVFLKYYTPAKGQQIHFWGPHDREGYLKEMTRSVRPYLKSDGSLP